MSDAFSRAIYYSKSYIELTKPGVKLPSDEDFQAAASVAYATTPNPDFTVANIIDQLRTDFIHYQPPWEVLDEDQSATNHEEWLSESKEKINWQFWNRYERFLCQEGRLPNRVIYSLGELTDDILRRLESPERPGPWDRRGLVVGEVQAGKTGNYTALICKALDAGYKVIVVLAGLHKNLRSQTQLRLDTCIRGRTRTGIAGEELIGVGRMRGMGVDRVVHYLTDSSDNGDFKVTRVAGVQIGSDPVVLVVKKNKSILENVQKWIKENDTSHATFPFLLIDDEADHASINTRAGKDENDLSDDEDLTDEEIEFLHRQNVTAINRLIRELLQLSSKTAYVGYTATPQANLFVDPDAVAGRRIGADIFPESFIVNINSPTNYFGPERVFGFEDDENGNISGSPGLPIIRPVLDHDDEKFFPFGHKKTHVPEDIPASLKKAIRSFILTVAARRARGQVNVHNSMLIHVTRFVDVQGHVKERVEEELATLKLRIHHGDGESKYQVMTELRELWEEDYAVTSSAMEHETGDPPLQWATIESHIKHVVDKIAEVRGINGGAKDALDYLNYPDGLTVIAVGGNKLSRGLTLEGLSVSYYLRASRMYDTLMQMGRWFGYRGGYEDLCRLYTTPDLVKCYRGIALADHELRREFSRMNDIPGATPADYGLKVRTGLNGMLVTALNKMRHGTDMDFSFSDSTAQLPYFAKDSDVAEHNFEITRSFLESLPLPDRKSEEPHLFWRKVDARDVIRFASQFKCCAKAFRVDAKRIAEYIETQNRYGNLLHWDVALVNIRGKESFKKGGILSEVGMSVRKNDEKYGDAQTFSLPKSQLLDPNNNSIGLKLDELKFAESFTRARLEKKNKKYKYPLADIVQQIRGQRMPKPEGLLQLYVLDPEHAGVKHPLIGYGFMFPPIKNDKPISYKVNKTCLKAIQLELGIDDI